VMHVFDHIHKRNAGNEAQISRTVGIRLKLVPAFMQVYFLRAKGKRFSILTERENFYAKNSLVKLAGGSYGLNS
jgi:hypothetical protein